MKCKSCFLGKMIKKYFKMSAENFTQNVKRYGLQKQIAHGLCMVKPIITCTKRRISLHTLSLHISSLIRAFANRMYRPQTMGLTKRTFDSRAVQSGINSVTVISHSDQILR